MPVNSSTSSSKFKKLPWAFIVTVVLVLCVEFFVSSVSYIFSDRSTVVLRHKRKVMARRDGGQDIIVIGISRGLVVDATALEKATGGKYSVYNYSIANCDTNLQYYYMLRDYLDRKGTKPKLILLNVPQDAFVGYNFIDDASGIRMARFREFFGEGFFKKYVSDGKTNPYYYSWLWMFPSYANGSFFKKHYARGNFFSLEKLGKIISDANFRWKRLLDTKGVMLFNEDRRLGADYAVSHLPKKEDFAKHIIPNAGLEKMVQLAHENNIPVVFFETPVSAERYEVMKDLGYFPLYNDTLKRLEEKYDNFTFYEAPEFYGWGLEYFGDWVHHLNKSGAKRFNSEFGPQFLDILKQQKML